MTRRERNRLALRFNDRWVRVIGVPVAGLAISILIFGVNPMKDGPLFYSQTISSMIYTFLHWEFHRATMIILRGRMPAVQDTVKRLLIQSLIMSAGIFFITFICGLGLESITTAAFGAQKEIAPYGRILLVTFVMSFFITGVYEAIYGMVRWRETELQSEKLKRESLQSQLDNLKSRVNPHFLFNSLNTLSALIHDRPDDAVRAVEQLARSYRYVLKSSELEVVQIREELENVQAYLFLLKTRFGEGLKVEIEVPPEAQDQFIIPLALQMLIENCIKHNVVRSKKALHIRIWVDQGAWVVVENNLQLKPHQPDGTGTGLSNIKSRYHLMGNDRVIIDQQPDKFTVKLPILHIQAYAPAHH